MKETFDEYKSTIEANLINFTYLYDGDVIDSEVHYYEEISNKPKVSPIIIIKCIDEIYRKSIELMFQRDFNEIIVKKEEFFLNRDNFIHGLHSKNFNPTYIFTSDKFKVDFSNNKSGVFPNYFYKSITSTHYGFDYYRCPLINDNEDDLILYVTDKSIQALVYGIQNMEYKIENYKGGYKHIIKYNLYNCDYNIYKLKIKDVSKLREDKINEILG